MGKLEGHLDWEETARWGTQAWTFIGATGVRKFVDDTLLSGSSPVTYQVTAVRSTQRGLPASFNVSFGVGGGGISVAEVTGSMSGSGVRAKLAV